MKKPPLDLRLLRMPINAATAIPIKEAMVKNLCSDAACLISKKTFEKELMVCFGSIFGGLATTFGIVSRMDVRDGMM